MKKITITVLSALLVLSLAGCAAKTQTTANSTSSTASSGAESKVTYKDGTYDVKTKSKKGGYEEAVLTVKDGKIQNVELKRLDDSSKEINYDEWDGTKGGKPNLKQFRQDLAKTIIEKQTTKVDSITGATMSSDGWKQSVSDALAKASK